MNQQREVFHKTISEIVNQYYSYDKDILFEDTDHSYFSLDNLVERSMEHVAEHYHLTIEQLVGNNPEFFDYLMNNEEDRAIEQLVVMNVYTDDGHEDYSLYSVRTLYGVMYVSIIEYFYSDEFEDSKSDCTVIIPEDTFASMRAVLQR